MPGFSKSVERTIVVRVLTGWPGCLMLPQHALQALDGGRGDLEHVAVVPRDVVALEHVGIVGEGLDRGSSPACSVTG